MTTKKEHPALFTDAMVRAIGTGQKTQTRRIVKPQPIGSPWFWEGDEKDPTPQWFDGFERGRDSDGAPIEEVNKPMRSPYGQPGDRIWVRETWQAIHRSIDPETGLVDDVYEAEQIPIDNANGWWTVVYAATDPAANVHRDDRGFSWRPSIHMPRWAARYLLDVTAVRVERLQDISEEDARAEGVKRDDGQWVDDDGRTRSNYRLAFQRLWTSIYGAESWDANPWVGVTSFKLVTP